MFFFNRRFNRVNVASKWSTAVLRFNFIVLLLLAVSAQAMAMTVYDVIQLSKKNYSDQDIITLIEVTDSAFELKAEDIPHLAELGVSELVIQAMLSAIPAEPSVKSTPNTVASQLTALPSGNSSGNLAPRAKIDSESLLEEGSGGHHHQIIKLFGIRLFVLRDEGGYPSVAARAKTVAERLRTASAVDGQFRPAHVAGSDVVIFAVSGTTQTVLVVSVSAQDASAYQRRSGRQVTPDLLAAYWSNLLTDYWSIALGSQPPDRLAMLHEGDALQKLYDGLDKSIDNNTARLASAFQSLPKQERDHLLQLAISVPHGFNAADEHTSETP